MGSEKAEDVSATTGSDIGQREGSVSRTEASANRPPIALTSPRPGRGARVRFDASETAGQFDSRFLRSRTTDREDSRRSRAAARYALGDASRPTGGASVARRSESAMVRIQPWRRDLEFVERLERRLKADFESQQRARAVELGMERSRSYSPSTTAAVVVTNAASSVRSRSMSPMYMRRSRTVGASSPRGRGEFNEVNASATDGVSSTSVSATAHSADLARSDMGSEAQSAESSKMNWSGKNADENRDSRLMDRADASRFPVFREHQGPGESSRLSEKMTRSPRRNGVFYTLTMPSRHGVKWEPLEAIQENDS